MESTYFPVPFSKLPSNIEIEELPGFQFRHRHHARSRPTRQPSRRHRRLPAVFARWHRLLFPDVEPRAGGEDREMIDFVRDADVLILDSQYDRDEYRKTRRLGPRLRGRIRRARPQGQRQKNCCSFTTIRTTTIKKIDALVKYARRLVTQAKGKLKVDAAREGMVISLATK